MDNYKTIKINCFLKERDGKYKPTDPKIKSLTRLDKIDFSGKMYFSDKASKTDMIIAKKGDLVISGINVAKGALSVHEGKEDITATIHYSAYQIDNKKINIEYFKFFLKSPLFIQLLKKQVKGGIKTEIKPKHLLPLQIKLPDLKTQESIVSSFQITENKINNFYEQITLQQTLLKKLRQAILQETMEGKLTAEWRKQNQKLISDKNGALPLLEKIKAEKKKLIKKGKLKKQKPLPPINKDKIPFDLPKGWVWCRLGDVGIVNPRNYIDDNLDISFIPMANISKQYGVSPILEVKKWHEVKSGFTHLAENDIGIAKITPCFENSKACIFNKLKNGFGAGTTELHIIRLITNDILPAFIYLLLKSSEFLLNGKKLMKGTAGQKRVTVSYFQNTLFAIPPLAEQQAIVKKVNKLTDKFNQIDKQIENSKQYAEQLMRAFLKEAFNGNYKNN